MAVQCNALPWKPDASAMQRKALQANVSKANARQCNAVQIQAKQSNVNQCNVKHKAIHMQMRRRAMPYNVMRCKPMRGTERTRRAPGTQRIRDGEPKERFWEAGLTVASAIGLIRKSKGGGRNAEGRLMRVKRGYRRKEG